MSGVPIPNLNLTDASTTASGLGDVKNDFGVVNFNPVFGSRNSLLAPTLIIIVAGYVIWKMTR